MSQQSEWLEDKARLNAVITFADNALKNGRDHYRAHPTPLFADGINTCTGEHVRWRAAGKTPVISDLACQQNLFRTLTALTNLTGDAKYKDAAQAAIQSHFDHLTDSSGLLHLTTFKQTSASEGDTEDESATDIFQCAQLWRNRRWNDA